MNTTYLILLTIIESFASQHQEVKRFKSDFLEQLGNFGTEGDSYPILYVSPNTNVFNYNQYTDLNTFTLTFYCVDIIQKDRNNINTILNTTNLILNDVHKFFRDSEIPGIEVLSASNVTPLNNYLMDFTAGWTMSMTFELESYSVCEIPFNDAPILPTAQCDIIYSRWATEEQIQDLQNQINEINSFDCSDLEVCEIITTIQTNISNLELELDSLRSSSITTQSVTINTDPAKFDVNVTGYIIDPTTLLKTDITVNLTAQTIPNLATQNESYLLIDNTGSLVIQDEPPTMEQYSTHLCHWILVHSNRVNINVINSLPFNEDTLGSQFQQVLETIGAIRTGLDISPGTTSTRVSLSSGSLFRKGLGLNPDNKNSKDFANQIDLTFRIRLSDGTESANLTTLPSTQYESGGVLVSATGNRVLAYPVFVFPSGMIRMQYSQRQYDNMNTALLGIENDSFILEDNIRRNSVQCGWILIQRNTSDWSNPDRYRFIVKNKFGTANVGNTIVPTIQNTYDVSTQPQLITTLTKGAVQYQNGTGSDTSTTQEWLNNAGSLVASITGQGYLTAISLSIANEYTFPLTDGTPNQVLQTDGAGNVSWQTISTSDTNFANTNLTFSSNRFHNTNGFSLDINTDNGVYAQAWLFMTTTVSQYGFDGNWLDTRSTGTSLYTNSTIRLHVDNSGYVGIGGVGAVSGIDLNIQSTNDTSAGRPFRIRNSTNTESLAYVSGEGEIKNKIDRITVELIDALTVDFYASSSFSIQSITDIVNAPTTTILLNDAAYTLTDPIVSGDKITVTVDTAAVVNLLIYNVI